MTEEHPLSRLHYELIRALIERGTCPTNADLANQMGLASEEVERLLRALADIHGVVLHPQTSQPWVIHPFSLTPTINWIAAQQASWWAPCIWSALGVAVLVGGDVRIHTRYGAESEPLVISVQDGHLANDQHAFVHFAIPPARAWDNVHKHCSLVLPFRSEHEIDEWCRRHRLPRGESVPLQKWQGWLRLGTGPMQSQTGASGVLRRHKIFFNEQNFVRSFGS